MHTDQALHTVTATVPKCLGLAHHASELRSCLEEPAMSGLMYPHKGRSCGGNRDGSK